MGYLNALIENFAKLDIPDVVNSVVADTERFIVEAMQDQLLHGIRSDGSKIGEYKQEAYAVLKFSMNDKAGFPFVDLRKTGKFYNTITATIIGDELVIDSFDDKYASIVKKYGEVLLLNEEHYQYYYDNYVYPESKKTIEEQIGLKFGNDIL